MIKKSLILTALVLIATTAPSYAYLDPGTGSMVIQILVASFAAVAIFFRQIWQGIQMLFGKKPNVQSEEEEE